MHLVTHKLSQNRVVVVDRVWSEHTIDIAISIQIEFICV